MKYYAVTEDPNELFHYGVKGMKWGQHIFGDKPKSPGYKRALGKLRASAKSAKSAIQKSATQHSINKQNRQMDRYNKAVQKAQRNNELVNNLHYLDTVRVNERGLDRDYWGAAKVARIRDKQQQKMDRINNKRMIKEAKAQVKYNKNEAKMDKYMQQAREGKLKYGQLSDDQVQRLTARLNMESNARKLGSAEKTWRQQKKEAFRQGKLQGITKGTAAAMEEVARAGTIYGIQNLMNRKKRNALAKQEGKEERIKSRVKNARTHKEIREDLRREMYEEGVASGQSAWERRRRLTVQGTAENLQRIKDANADRAFRLTEAQNIARNERQNRENEVRAERQRELAGKEAYEYGALLSGSGNSGGGKGKGQGNNGGGSASISGNSDEVKRLADWYKQKYVDKETNQQRQKREFNEDIRKRAERIRKENAAQKREFDEDIRKRAERIRKENKTHEKEEKNQQKRYSDAVKEQKDFMRRARKMKYSYGTQIPFDSYYTKGPKGPNSWVAR